MRIGASGLGIGEIRSQRRPLLRAAAPSSYRGIGCHQRDDGGTSPHTSETSACPTPASQSGRLTLQSASQLVPLAGVYMATEEGKKEATATKQGTVVVQSGQPLQFTGVVDASSPSEGAASVAANIGTALAAYMKAARKLLEGKYKSQAALAPAHLRESCDVFAVRCLDGILVRYERASSDPPRVRCGEMPKPLAEIAPMFSDQVLHFPDDPTTYVPPNPGPEVVLSKMDMTTGSSQEYARFRPLVYGTTKLPPDFQL